MEGAMIDQPPAASSARISPAERMRRHEELTAEMEREGLDALVVYGRGEPKHRGRVFYCSDIWQFAGDAFVVLPRTGKPFFVNTPLVGLDEAKMSDWITDLRMDYEPGTLIGDALRNSGLEHGVVGVAGWSDALPLNYGRQLERSLPNAEIRDATGLFDRVRQAKSPEEIGCLRETSAVT